MSETRALDARRREETGEGTQCDLRLGEGLGDRGLGRHVTGHSVRSFRAEGERFVGDGGCVSAVQIEHGDAPAALGGQMNDGSTDARAPAGDYQNFIRHQCPLSRFSPSFVLATVPPVLALVNRTTCSAWPRDGGVRVDRALGRWCLRAVCQE